MALTFQRAPTVETGERITSTQLAKLATAFNDRLRSGIADGDWRIAFYLLSLFRQIRNPDASGTLFPPIAEFFTEYQSLSPTDGEWPAVGPGEPEGANLDALAPVFVHGSVDTDLDPEVTRMAGVPLVLASASDSVIWENTKQQRGAVDVATGLISSASWDAARTAYYIRSSNQSPHGNSYGGYQPLFHLNGDCGDGDTDIQATPKYDILFTNLDDATTLTYDSCLVGYVEGPEAYYVFEASGVTVLPYSTWIAGPKTEGARLTKRFGNHLPRILNAWVQTFRGTTEQAGQRIRQRAPDWQTFFTSYYHLAPARGNLVNAEDNIIEAVYPLFSASADQASGTTIHCNTAGQAFYPVNESFVVTSFYVSGTNHNDTAIQLLSDGIVVASASLGADQTGRIVSLLTAPIAAGSVVSVKLTRALTFRGSGTFRVELAETYAYKPGVHDAYLLTRLGAANPAADLTGQSFSSGKQLGQDYFTKCGVVGRNSATLPAAEDATNQNAVFEAARQLSKNVRFIKRQLLRKYAVIGGKSVLWFTPTNTVGGVATNPWEAIAGLIAPTASAQGWTNEWLLRVNFRVYQAAESSIWKPDSYSDYFPLVERCHLYNRQLFDLGEYDLVSHFNYGDKFSFAPEAPPGYRYANGTNANAGRTATSGDRSNFYKSCQVYQAPYEIETAEYDTDGLVKVTLKTRMQSEATAPASVSSDVSSWSLTDIRAEAYRTDENGLREYLYHQHYGDDCDREKIGDGALETQLWTDFSNVRGACYPMFVLTKLVPLPYDDGNDRQHSVDTKVLVDQFTVMETYIRAMAEGYIDGQTTDETACDLATPAFYDFSFEAMCFQAFGGRSFGFMPLDSREDRPTGFGPIPNTDMMAGTFNEFSAAINLLTSARVMLPLVLNSNMKRYTRIGPNMGGSSYNGPAGAEPGEGDYVSETGVRAIGPTSFAINATNSVDNSIGLVRLTSTKDIEFIEVSDGGTGALEAIPEAWRDLMEGGTGLTMLAEQVDTIITLTHGADPTCADITSSTTMTTTCVHFTGPSLVPPPLPGALVTYQGVGFGSPCNGGNDAIRQLNITSDDAFAVTIPLTVD